MFSARVSIMPSVCAQCFDDRIRHFHKVELLWSYYYKSMFIINLACWVSILKFFPVEWVTLINFIWSSSKNTRSCTSQNLSHAFEDPHMICNKGFPLKLLQANITMMTLHELFSPTQQHLNKNHTKWCVTHMKLLPMTREVIWICVTDVLCDNLIEWLIQGWYFNSNAMKGPCLLPELCWSGQCSQWEEKHLHTNNTAITASYGPVCQHTSLSWSLSQ